MRGTSPTRATRTCSTSTCAICARRSTVPSAGPRSRPSAESVTSCDTSVLRKLPIRVRLTLAFALGVAVILTGVGGFVYARMGADLLAATDGSLGAQADALEAAMQAPGATLGLGFGPR